MVMTYKHPNNIPLFYKRGVQSGIYTWSTNTLLLLAKLPACPPCRFMLRQRNMEESQGRQYALVTSSNQTATFSIPLYLVMLNPIIIAKRTIFGIIVRIEEIEYPFFGCSIRRTDGQHAVARARKSFFSIISQVIRPCTQIVQYLGIVHIRFFIMIAKGHDKRSLGFPKYFGQFLPSFLSIPRNYYITCKNNQIRIFYTNNFTNQMTSAVILQFIRITLYPMQVCQLNNLELPVTKLQIRSLRKSREANKTTN